MAKLRSFWGVQLVGWTAFCLFKLPPTIDYMGSTPYGVWTCGYHGVMGFIFSFVLRKIFLVLKRGPLFPFRLGLSIMAVGILDTAIFTGIDLLVLGGMVGDKLNILFYTRPIIYLAWSAIYLAVSEFQKARQRELDLHEAKSASLRAEVQMLRAQMDPHFLFNAFNTILAGLGRDGASTECLVQSLADYFRYSLDCRGEAMVPVKNEFESLGAYLFVEKSRFRDSLRVEAHLADDARELLVPGIMLQPLVENALKHGFMTSASPLEIRLAVVVLPGGEMQIEVANSGSWIDPVANRSASPGGNGLAILRSRLELIYPNELVMEFPVKDTPGEVVMRIRFPVPAPNHGPTR